MYPFQDEINLRLNDITPVRYCASPVVNAIVTVKAEEALSKKRDPEKALGEMLFAAVNAVRQCGKNADIALNEATDRFIEDFQEEKCPEKAVKMPKNAPNT